MSAIMQYRRVAPIRPEMKLSRVSDFCAAAMIRLPITPMAAASVAVAMPE